MSLLLLSDSYGVDTQLAYSWRIRQILDATPLAYSWRIRQYLNQTLVYSWKIWNYVDKALIYSWRIRKYLDRALVYSWMILSCAGSPRPRHTFTMPDRVMQFYSDNVVDNYKRKYGEIKDNETIL